MTNHIKARIDMTQQYKRCRLCGDRDGTINHIISECSKLAQKEYKTRHDWIGKVIHRNCARNWSSNVRTNGKWITQNNETHKLHWDFEMQTNQLISARRPDLIIINKKERTCRIVDFAVLADHRLKLKECRKRDKYLLGNWNICGIWKWR